MDTFPYHGGIKKKIHMGFQHDQPTLGTIKRSREVEAVRMLTILPTEYLLGYKMCIKCVDVGSYA